MENYNDINSHCIGGINFKTITDFYFPDLHERGINLYKTNDINQTILNYIHGIKFNTFAFPILTAEQRSRIGKFFITSDITEDRQVFIPYISHGDRIFSQYLAGIVDSLDVPLLRSPEVQVRLNACLDHSDQVVLIVHAFFIEIRDFLNHQLEIFYIDELAPLLETTSTRDSVERMFRIFLPDFDAMLIHSAVINRNGKAVFFLAPNGGGKTTIARQVHPESVLSDDQTILRREDGNFMVYSTPWGRIVNSSKSIPLGGFFIIEKAKHFELVPLKSRQMISFLWNEHFPFFELLPKFSRTNVFNLLYQAVSNVPLYLLRTPLDGIDWDKIDASL